jgi:hypothetical protein
MNKEAAAAHRGFSSTTTTTTTTTTTSSYMAAARLSLNMRFSYGCGSEMQQQQHHDDSNRIGFLSGKKMQILRVSKVSSIYISLGPKLTLEREKSPDPFIYLQNASHALNHCWSNRKSLIPGKFRRFHF